MAKPARRGIDTVNLVPQERQAWQMQIWMLLVLVVSILGTGIAVYIVLKHPTFKFTAEDVLDLVPPFMFAVVAVFLLAGFYMAQREAIVHALREELLTQKIEAELNRELTLLDPVTEVYNRRYARVILTREASRVKRNGTALALMLVDISGFRRVNDSIGHTGGDVVLRQIAHLLQSKIRNSDIIVRFGGDEFLLILPEAEEKGIERLVCRLKRSIIDWAPLSGLSDFGLRFAVGVAYFRGEGRIDEILSTAEERMLGDRGTPDPVPEPAASAAASS